MPSTPTHNTSKEAGHKSAVNESKHAHAVIKTATKKSVKNAENYLKQPEKWKAGKIKKTACSQQSKQKLKLSAMENKNVNVIEHK